MINVMRALALLDLNHRFHSAAASMEQLRQEQGMALAPLLVEASEKIPRVYLLQAVPGEPGKVRLWPEEMTDDKRLKLPFNKPSGSQSAAIGPVFKRTCKPKDNPPYGPSVKIQNTTCAAFQALATSTGEWAEYFAEINNVLFTATVLEFGGTSYALGANAPDEHALAAAVRLLPETETVFLSVSDSAGRWPGERTDYQAYLAQVLADMKYVTGATAIQADGECPLCGKTATSLYPNALKGAGLNFGNADRAGAFPGLATEQAWKGYGLCLDCADLLYIFKNHILEKRCLGRIAGEKAMLLPELLGNTSGHGKFLKNWDAYVQHLDDGAIRSFEKDLMSFIAKQDDAAMALHIMWAQFGQVIDDVRGYIIDILPSRLQTLTAYNKTANHWQHPLGPHCAYPEASFDLSLSMLQALLRRPGGKAAKNANASVALFALKRDLAEAIYHGQTLETRAGAFWEEILATARWYLNDAAQATSDYGLLNEAQSGKGKPSLTLAGWVRHIARFLYYLDLTGVLPMDHHTYEPQWERLKPYFTPGGGLSSPEKAFTFLLGALYGKLLQVQSARGVNVAANALTWLKRLNLAGRDLPELYTKIREKLLSYETEANPDVRALLLELSRLGARLGNDIRLDTTATCYFLLLGQSLAVEILPSKSKKDASNDD